MADFSNYAAQREDGLASRPYNFEALEGAPGVLTRPATTANARYNNARLKALGKRTGTGRRKIAINAATVEAARREDADLLSKYCVTGWGDNAPVDSSGVPVPFSADNARDFFLAIPDWMFDDFRNWVSEPLNFVGDASSSDDGEDDDPADAEELGNSLPNGSDGTAASTETATA